MKRREVLAGIAVSTITGFDMQASNAKNAYLELKVWYLHNTRENQPTRVADYLERGLGPALSRAGAKLIGAFSNVIGPDGPFYVTLTQFASLATMGEAMQKLASDEQHEREMNNLGSGGGLPFVRVESSLLRSFDGMPQPDVPNTSEKLLPRIFELRTYESQTFTTLARKIGMFNGGEISIFQRLGMRPVFFGDTLIGPRQPNLMYMLSFDDLGARDKLWRDFGADPEWRKLSSEPQLKDSEIVSNISNVILRPLAFSLVQ